MFRVRFAVLPASQFGGYEFELLLGVGMRRIVQATRTLSCHSASVLETQLRLSSEWGACGKASSLRAERPHLLLSLSPGRKCLLQQREKSPQGGGRGSPGSPEVLHGPFISWEREVAGGPRGWSPEVLHAPFISSTVCQAPSRQPHGTSANVRPACRSLLRAETSSMPLLPLTNTLSETPVGCCTTWPVPSSTYTA